MILGSAGSAAPLARHDLLPQGDQLLLRPRRKVRGLGGVGPRRRRGKNTPGLVLGCRFSEKVLGNHDLSGGKSPLRGTVTDANSFLSYEML